MSMDKKTNSSKHHTPLSATHSPSAASPQLLRSKSGTSVASNGSRSMSISSKSRNRQINHPNSKTTLKSIIGIAHDPKAQKNLPNVNQYSDKSRSTSQNKTELVPRRTRSASTSPSAWALSPGRAQPLTPPSFMIVVPKSPITSHQTKKDSSSSINKSFSGVGRGVLSYFKRKKISSLQEEEYHQFRVLHNRLLQWRFMNARSEFSTTSLSRATQKSVINAFVKIYKARSMIVEKKFEIGNCDMENKVGRIVSPQLHLLEEWTRVEGKNCVAVRKLVRKLTAISASLPLIQGAQVDVQSFMNSMSMARKTMDSAKAIITDFQSQAEEICYLLTELSVLQEELMESISQLENELALVISLLAVERSLSVHRMQLADESK